MTTKTKLTNQQDMVLSVLRMGNFTEWEINNRLVISSTYQRVSELRQMGCVIDSVKQPEKKGHLLVLRFCPEGLEAICREEKNGSVSVDIPKAITNETQIALECVAPKTVTAKNTRYRIYTCKKGHAEPYYGELEEKVKCAGCNFQEWAYPGAMLDAKGKEL